MKKKMNLRIKSGIVAGNLIDDFLGLFDSGSNTSTSGNTVPDPPPAL